MDTHSDPDRLQSETTSTGLTTRRAFLSTAAIGTAGLLVAGGNTPVGAAVRAAATTSTHRGLAATTKCLALTPTEEVGPFYVNYGHVRSDIRVGQEGIPLTLRIKVIDATTCKPIHNAALDVWQANAVGVYSDEASENTTTQTYLRGIQLTSTTGHVTFTTIMPGWYSGRVNHIHTKVRLHGKDAAGKYSGGTTAHIGQLFFPQKINNECAKISPYTENTQTRITNATDRVYTQQNGDECRLSLSGSTGKGFVGHITLSVKA